MSIFKRVFSGTPAATEPADFDWISTSDLAQRLDRGDTLLLIDVRAPEEFHGPLGHIPGSLNLPVDAIAHDPGTIEPHRNRELVFVCRTQIRSANVASALRQAGFPSLKVLEGGVQRWNEEGRKIER